ncbi:conserved hypothetical protein [Candidatus Desulfarcum epimagneticum]|uniref:DUF4340 domain-containing protein n=1 Tax=uncultured Desulfobacteraceae bacterium TaxID=218296 RepID=A0A484HBG6_9BACT|nr:conserved hypothetical protein [uncultured Desulfobacteraceae bacterium]
MPSDPFFYEFIKKSVNKTRHTAGLEEALKPKTLLTLFVALCVAASAAWFFKSREDRRADPGFAGKRLIKGLDVNQIAQITLQAPDSHVELARGESAWTVKNRWDYPADFEKLTDFVKKLAGLKIGREFTGSDETLSRLSLLPPGQDGEKAPGRGTRAVFKNDSGDVMADLILGKTRSAQSGSGGHYVRLGEDSAVFLVDKSFRFLETDPAQWMDVRILDVPADEVERIDCFVRSKGKNRKRYSLKRPARGKPPELEGVAKSKKFQASKTDGIFKALAPLYIEDVADPGKKWGAAFDKKPFYAYRLYDGAVYTVRPGGPLSDQDERRYFKVEAAFPAPDKDATPDSARDAQRKKTAGGLSWTYVVSKWTADIFSPDPASYFEK